MKKIREFLSLRSTYLISGAIALVALLLIIGSRNSTPDWTSDMVTRGTVRNIISVSGVIDAVESAELAFPQSGTLESMTVSEGDMVTQGQVLATLAHDDLKADYQDAYAALLVAQANRDELLNGLRPEERDIARTTADIARDNLARVTKEQHDLVANAYVSLLSTDLEARPESSDNDDTPPVISGTYTCGKEGVYLLEMFRSSARSGYSYRLSGLESGTFTAFTESSAPLGSCGLRIQFAPGQNYGNSEWTVSLPNTNSGLYVANKNAYTLALTQRDNAVSEAEQELQLALQNERLDIASPRSESLAREEAKVLQARARLSGVKAQMDKHVLTAPFAGTISHIAAVPGETVLTAPIITMVSNSAFEITALIPEIDVTRISLGQKAEILFDARGNETLTAIVTFISPLAKEIDGVSYFEAKLALDTDPDWIRSGLNADVDILVDTRDDVTRIPKRYLIPTEDDAYTVLVPDGDETRSVPVTVEMFGNDGFVQVSGIEEGTVVVAP